MLSSFPFFILKTYIILSLFPQCRSHCIEDKTQIHMLMPYGTHEPVSQNDIETRFNIQVYFPVGTLNYEDILVYLLLNVT